MQIRLGFCSCYLKEVEEKLTKLHATISDDPEARVTVDEAVGFVREARRAVSNAQERIEMLRARHNRRSIAQNA